MISPSTIDSWFLKILFVSAFAIAACAAFFSIYGLANIYSAFFISVVCMGTVLEIGKLVTVSALYRYWELLPKWLIGFMIGIILPGLLIITSAGVYGYLSNAYQADSINLKDNESQILMLEEQLTYIDTQLLEINKEKTLKRKEIEEQKTDSKESKNLRTSSKQTENQVSVRDQRRYDKVQQSYDAKITTLKQEVESLDEQRKDLLLEKDQVRKQAQEAKRTKISVEAHTGPIIYIAKALDKDVDTAIMWLTLLIVVVFDPLAVALTLVGNIVLGKPTNLPTQIKENIIDEKKDTPPVEKVNTKNNPYEEESLGDPHEPEPTSRNDRNEQPTDGPGGELSSRGSTSQHIESKDETSQEDDQKTDNIQTQVISSESDGDLSLIEPHPLIDNEAKLIRHVAIYDEVNPLKKIEQKDVTTLNSLIKEKKKL